MTPLRPSQHVLAGGHFYQRDADFQLHKHVLILSNARNDAQFWSRRKEIAADQRAVLQRRRRQHGVDADRGGTCRMQVRRDIFFQKHYRIDCYAVVER